MRPRLAVAAVLAAASFAAGGYYLWPKGRELGACAPRTPMSEGARQALDSYKDRIHHDVNRSDEGARREETWSDPTTGARRQVLFDEDGRITVEIGTIRDGKRPERIWVAHEERTWYSNRDPTALLAQPDAAAAEAQAYRDRVARGRARVVGRGRIGGQDAIELHETVVPLRLSVPGSPPPARPAPALQIDTWVDRLSYVALRKRTVSGGHWSQVDSTWLPRTTASVARTRVVIPAGFTRIHPRVSGFSDTVLVSRARCAQS